MFASKTDKLMARTAIGILSIGLLYTLYTLGAGPLYYKFVATVVRPFQGAENAFDLVLDDDPFSATEAQKLIQNHNKQDAQGEGAAPCTRHAASDRHASHAATTPEPFSHHPGSLPAPILMHNRRRAGGRGGQEAIRRERLPAHQVSRAIAGGVRARASAAGP
jgi:hypothetical protein